MRQPPPNWPEELIFTPHCVSYDIHRTFFDEILFTGREADRQIISELIEKGEIHSHLKVERITPELHYRGVSPHPLSQSSYVSRPQCGLFATEDIAEGIDVGEYVGQLQVMSDTGVLNSKEVEYTWLLKNGPFVFEVNSKKWASEIALVNDYRGLAPRPNVTCGVCIHRGRYHLVYRSIKPILRGEEVLVNYGEGYWSSESRRSLLPK